MLTQRKILTRQCLEASLLTESYRGTGILALQMVTGIKELLKMAIDVDSDRWNIKAFLFTNELELEALKVFRLKGTLKIMELIMGSGIMTKSMDLVQ